MRRYEHIRDIMNSWDRDTQNALILEASDSPNHDFDLEASSVPAKQPRDVTVYMYHSQKPGKWNKRYITLLSNGQIFLSKSQGAKVSDKDITTICHLTDFDIYTPTAQLRKTIRPPKKHCYAVKSQQKTSMFLSTENFVHFFSTDDSELASKWYDACQQWRSWYLVNMMGEGQKKAVSRRQTVKLSDTRVQVGGNHKIKISVDETPYAIGSFKPLLDLGRFDTATSNANDEDDEDENEPRQIPFHLRNISPINGHPPHHRKQDYLPSAITLTSDEEDPNPTFAPTGLLGRTYTHRQRLQKERDHSSDANSGPFIPGPSLLNDVASSQRPKTGIDADYQHHQGPYSSTRSQGHTRLSPSKSMRRPETSAGPGPSSSARHFSASSAMDRDRTRNVDGDNGRLPSLTRINGDRLPSLPRMKPLIDLTPKFVEAPQWSREGKGHGVQAPKGVPLVKVATSGQEKERDAMPSGTLLRREG